MAVEGVSVGPESWQLVRVLPRAFHDVVPASFRAGAVILATRRREINALMRSQSNTLLHGDTHLGNICFVGGRPVIFDWQVASLGPALKDLSYFAGTSLTTNDRRAIDEGHAEGTPVEVGVSG